MTRFEAAARYRKMVAAIIEHYHKSVGTTWVRHGRPPSDPACARELAHHWIDMKIQLRAAGEWLDQFPVRLGAA